MTEHLGERISPLIDYQLDHDARDRALAHLAVCALCQREVAELREVKARLTALRDPALSDAFTARLLGIALAAPPSSRTGTPPDGRAPVGEGGVARGRARRGPGGPPRRAGAGPPSRRSTTTSGRSGTGPSSGGPRGQRMRRSVSRRPGSVRSNVRRTLLGSAALIVLVVAGAAAADGNTGARPGGSVAVPTVSSVVTPASSTGGSLRLLPGFTPMKVSLRR